MGGVYKTSSAITTTIYQDRFQVLYNVHRSSKIGAVGIIFQVVQKRI
jgi:hypothetical protein